MSEKPNSASQSAGLDLSAFQQTPDQGGLSLDQLNAAFAQMLGQGVDPYVPPPVADPLAPEALLADPRDAANDAPATDAPLTPRGILEAMLFVGAPDNTPLTAETVAAHMRGVRATEVDTLARELAAEYRANGCPYAVITSGAGYRLELRREFFAIRDRCFQKSRRVRLSAAATEVLSIVAYNQPATKEQIDRLRGKSSAALLRQLVHRQLLEVERDPDAPRIQRYQTTDRFLDLYNLAGLHELPKNDDIERR